MSTFRIARHGVDMDTGADGVDRRGVVVVILLCVALFAGCFAIGRAASPRGGSGGQSSTSLPVAFAGAAVPFRLSGAPPIQMRIAARRHATVRAPESHAARTGSARAITPALTRAAPRVQSPVREVARAPTPPVQSTPQPAPASARGGEGGGSKPHTSSGAGASFDSSG